EGVPAAVKLAASNHESSPARRPGRPTADAASCSTPTKGWSGGTSIGSTSIPKRTSGGWAASQESVAAAAATARATSSRIVPASRGTYITSQVSVQLAG